ncbi:MAG: YXWGXW repeat-containing protein [Deltaproteobacteria bacterium]|nr:YXWGXW repeat-containing protein [Deltaproteobacteria bacterium]
MMSVITLALLLSVPAVARADWHEGKGHEGHHHDVGGVHGAQPPPPRYEAPSPRHHWVPGYWAWRNGAHVWVDGTWVLPPEGYVWEPARWENVDGEWVFFEGHWRPVDQPDATVVYQPPAPPVNEVVVEAAPPPPVEEVQPPMPFANAYFVPGHWWWNGYRYAWIAGRWTARPAGYVWEAARWEHRPDGRWGWRPGYWRR